MMWHGGGTCHLMVVVHAVQVLAELEMVVDLIVWVGLLCCVMNVHCACSCTHQWVLS